MCLSVGLGTGTDIWSEGWPDSWSDPPQTNLHTYIDTHTHIHIVLQLFSKVTVQRGKLAGVVNNLQAQAFVFGESLALADPRSRTTRPIKTHNFSVSELSLIGPVSCDKITQAGFLAYIAKWCENCLLIDFC